MLSHVSISLGLLVATLFSVSVSSYASPPPPPPSVYRYYPASGHYYRLLDHMSWTDANQAALNAGGHLAVINDGDENEWVAFNVAYYASNTSVWIGFFDPSDQGNFEWVNGEPVGFVNWGAGEPNELATEHYAEMFNNNHPDNPANQGRWNNITNDNLRYGLVESPREAIGLTEEWIFDANSGHYYRLSHEHDFAGYVAEATSVRGYPASINTAEDNAFIIATFGNIPAENSFWIGLSDAGGEGIFVWTNDDAVSFTNWAPDEPNDSDANEDYTTIYNNFGNFPGSWNDVPGSEIRVGIIETGSRTFGDLTGDGCTDLNDFLIMLDNWQQPYGGEVVDLDDFLNILDNWQSGPTCA